MSRSKYHHLQLPNPFYPHLFLTAPLAPLFLLGFSTQLLSLLLYCYLSTRLWLSVCYARTCVFDILLQGLAKTLRARSAAVVASRNSFPNGSTVVTTCDRCSHTSHIVCCIEILVVFRSWHRHEWLGVSSKCVEAKECVYVNESANKWNRLKMVTRRDTSAMGVPSSDVGWGWQNSYLQLKISKYSNWRLATAAAERALKLLCKRVWSECVRFVHFS
jgi:hypothetical protein